MIQKIVVLALVSIYMVRMPFFAYCVIPLNGSEFKKLERNYLQQKREEYRNLTANQIMNQIRHIRHENDTLTSVVSSDIETALTTRSTVALNESEIKMLQEMLLQLEKKAARLRGK